MGSEGLIVQSGISSYAYGWGIGFDGARPVHPMNELDLIDRAVRHGVSKVQIADNLPLEHFTSERLRGLRQAADVAEIGLEVGARRLTVERITQYAALTQMLDSPLLRFVIDDRDYHPGIREVQRIISQSLPVLDGVTLAIENHDRFRVQVLRELLESIDSPQVAICLDTANSLGAGEGIDTVLRELGPWTVNLHVKDVAIERIETMMGFTVNGRPAGRGQIDIPALITSLESFGRCQSAIVELWVPRETTLEATLAKEEAWVADSCAYLKTLLETPL